MITCKTATDYISKKEEGKLNAAQRRALWFHLLVCKVCKRFDLQNTLITNAIRRRVDSNRKLTSTEKNDMINKMEQNNDD